MNPKRIASCCALALAALALMAPGASAAAPAAWTISATPVPSNFTPGTEMEVMIAATNVGAGPTTATSVLEATLPDALTPLAIADQHGGFPAGVTCSIATPQVSCETAEVPSSDAFFMLITAAVKPGSEGVGTITAKITGGGVTEASTSVSSPIQTDPVPFGVSPPGLLAPLTEADGSPATLAGSHPYQQTVDFGFPSQAAGEDAPPNAGHPHEILIHLPPGLIGNPAASAALCSEAQLQTGACSPESQIGIFGLTTLGAGKGYTGVEHLPLYNMIPPPGKAAELGVNIAGVGIFAHIFGSVRTDGDYGIDVTTPDVIAFGTEPIYHVQTQVWGDPSDSSHPTTCQGGQGTCAVPKQETAFWTLPTHCTAQPDTTVLEADTWEEPSIFRSSSYQSADLPGSPVALNDCASLEFEPKIQVAPTTNLSDSPSGLQVDLKLPTNTELGHRSPPPLKDASVTLPEGMVVNPSQADGLGVCDSGQIGLTNRGPANCPQASRLGTVEVTSPLLAEYEEVEVTNPITHQIERQRRVVRDPVSKQAIPRPLEGSLFLAKPFDNPFDSLLALYLTVEDPQSGTNAKLAGEIRTDPQTGKITTVFKQNPQLPLEEIHLTFFNGARAPLITPPTCATHTTSATLTPWSAPDTPDAELSPSFQTTAAPGGGACPTTEGALPNSPAFTAGTLTRGAGTYSPFVLKISREDGTQRLTKIDTLLPPGLAARFAGVPECSDAQIAAAAARSHPEEGRLELAGPSCPAASKLGSVDVGAGAGPTPIYTSGNAYLAGPYKGAPLSLAIITPAIAGPFDLGTVVVRTALFVDPETAQSHAVSDPLPTILDGIPLDVRSIALKLDRPDFTLNPTSCDPLAITGTATSALGQAAPLTQPFQVGGCNSLPFKPKLSLQLKGKTKRTSHPTLIANLSAKPGEANIARAQVKLPKAAFLDNAHIGTICTKVQFAAKSCPPESVYGTVSATTPLLDYTLTGNVYLRSSTHQLPDLVADLNGPATQPIEIALAGKTDSIKGALRNTFEAVPDAPVSSFHLQLFGGHKGLIILSAGLCKSPKAQVQLDGQNGKAYDTEPVVRTSCPKKGAKNHHGHRQQGGGKGR